MPQVSHLVLTSHNASQTQIADQTDSNTTINAILSAQLELNPSDNYVTGPAEAEHISLRIFAILHAEHH